MFASIPDLLRLLAVPVLGWAAWRDVKVRRVPNVAWYPLAILGVALVAWETLSPRTVTRLYLLRVGVSAGFLVPLTYVFWRLGGFGGADAKALMALAILFPVFPRYSLAGLPGASAFPWIAVPAVTTQLGVFSWTILTNTVLVGVLYPAVLGIRNALVGEFSALMFVGRRVRVSGLSTDHGRLFEDDEGFTRSGLDLDALRMYLRWRGGTLAGLREAPDRYRDPATIEETYDPTDGAVVRGTAVDGGATDTTSTDGLDVIDPGESSAEDEADQAPAGVDDVADPWGAEAFLAHVEGSAYGTTPEKLRAGLDVVARREEVWISPGIPFLVPTFAGLVVGLIYGDLLFGLLTAAGLA